MEVPRSLFHTNPYFMNNPGDGHICEAGDPEANALMAPVGTVLDEAEAKRLGIIDYLAQHPAPPAAEEKPAEPEAKAVQQAEVEDKSVTPPEGGVHMDAEARRSPGRRGG